MELLTGKTLLDRYFLLRPIGSGGMADVYLAWDQLRSAKMALKVLRRDLASSPRVIQLFHREAAVLRQLEHPNIVRLYEFEQDGEIAFIVMDWVEGKNLGQLLQEIRTPLSVEDISRILKPVCSALHYAHQNRVFHCDIKPANIMLHVDGRVLLTDFGVARLAEEDGDGGTPPYMAPEQFEDEPVDARTDVYALGVTLYEMLAGGKVPFRGDSPNSQGSTLRDRIAWEHRFLPVPPLRNFNPRVDAALEQVVALAMCKEPGQRYPSVIALRDAFERAALRQRTAPGRSPGESAMQTVFPHAHSPEPSVPSPAQNYASPHPAAPQVPVTPSRSTLPISTGAQPIPAVRGPHLFCRKGELAGRAVVIPPGGLTIGRGSQCQLRISEPSVSRQHAQIEFGRKGKIYLRDNNSSVGTYVNGVRIGSTVLLKPGDVIHFGYEAVFEYRE